MNYKSKGLKQVLEAATEYYEAASLLPQIEKSLREQYTGARLESELKIHKASVSSLQHCMNEIRDVFITGMTEKAQADLSKKTDSYMDAPPTADFAYLTLATPLTQEELQRLVSRNKYNPLFIRGAREYEQKHRKDWKNTLASIDYSTPHEQLQAQINVMGKHLSNITSRGGYDYIRTNTHILAELDAQLDTAAEAAGVKL